MAILIIYLSQAMMDHEKALKLTALNADSLLNWTINNKYLVLQKMIGGSFGEVYKALDVSSGSGNRREVVVKLLRKCKLRQSLNANAQKQLQYIEQEDKILRKFHHPNILEHYDTYANSDYKIIVTKFCNSGNLREELQKQRYKCFQLDKAINALKQICNAVTELHRKSIIHRDLKPENIFIHNGTYIIGDFGFSKLLTSNVNNTNCGTDYTQAPEVFSGKYGLNADIYSIGVIFFIMICSDGLNIEEKARRAKTADLTNLKFKMLKSEQPPATVIEFLRRALEPNPEKRMNWDELLDSHIFKPKIYQRIPCMLYRATNLENSKFKLNSMSAPSEIIIQDLEETKNESIILTKKGDVLINVETEGETECKIYEKLKIFHLYAKIAQFVLEQIISKIEQHGLLDLNSKSSIKLMYLLSARCFIDMSYAYNQCRKLKDFGLIEEVKKFIKSYFIEETYHKCQAKFMTYAEELTRQEDKVSSIISQRLRSVVRNNEEDEEYAREKIILNGVQKMDYEREQHVKLIQSRLNKFQSLKTNDAKLREQMLIKFKLFTAINEISYKEVEYQPFEDIVGAIILKNQ